MVKITDNITFVIITLTEIILSTRKKSITLPTCKIIHRVNQKCATIFSFVTDSKMNVPGETIPRICKVLGGTD